jgi:hypothetical protein
MKVIQMDTTSPTITTHFIVIPSRKSDKRTEIMVANKLAAMRKKSSRQNESRIGRNCNRLTKHDNEINDGIARKQPQAGAVSHISKAHIPR